MRRAIGGAVDLVLRHALDPVHELRPIYYEVLAALRYGSSKTEVARSTPELKVAFERGLEDILRQRWRPE